MSTGRFYNSAVIVIACFIIATGFWEYASAQEPPVVEPPYAAPFAVGNQFCPPVGDLDCVGATGSIYPTICNLVSPRELFAEPTIAPPENNFGWTTLLFQPGSTSAFAELMCAGIPYQDICSGPGIWGVPGTSSGTLRDFKSLMCDPSFDAPNKDIDPSTGNITGWEVIIPMVDRTDPMSAPDPNPVWGYVKVHIVEICVPGSPGCRGAGSCISYGFCTVGNKIVIDQISCFPCVGSSYIFVNPISFDFGNVLVGTSSAPQTWTILNDGNGILAIYPLQINGIHYSEFSTENDTCSGKILLPSEDCTVDLVFSPTSEGSKNANLSIRSNDPDTPELSIPLSGAGFIDTDSDGVPDSRDNCPFDQNSDQSDMDNDGKGDVCDICPNDGNNDIDSDGICGNIDNCPVISNPTQADTDGDGKGDACDACPLDANNDADGDGVCGNVDNCPQISNPSQSDSDGDGKGDACDSCPLDAQNDVDADGVCGDVDNCRLIANPTQADADEDGKGDACDPCPLDALNDIDGDTICGNTDNCPGIANPNQADMDRDGIGDACDNDADGDGFIKGADCNDLNPLINPKACDIRNDGIDQNCDGVDRTKGQPCVGEADGDLKELACADGIDNDKDGLIDCADPDCARKKGCR